MSRETRRGRARTPVWARPGPGERKPAYSRRQIVETAIAIADAEGFEAVSMRRIAAELGAGTMTLYHYVRTKDELMTLVADAVMSEILIPDDELPDGWREGMAELARRTRAIFVRHPWVVEHLGEGDPSSVGPSVLQHVEQTLAIASRSGLGVDEQFELAAIVDDYVFGYAIRSHEGMHRGTEDDAISPLDAVAAYLTQQLETGRYPHLEAFVGDDPAGAFARVGHLAGDEQRFERGLQRVLDGLELWVARARER
ncbi:MAG TPA: TetR/AcrR family transcriptional regulator [Solirubrobacteraceae bacterium]